MPQPLPKTPADQLLQLLSSPGRYQQLAAALLCLNLAPVAVSHTLMALLGFTPPHNCRVPKYWQREISLPRLQSANGTVSYSKCSMFIEPANHSWGTKGCMYGYEFHVQPMEWSIVSEWGLVCDREYLLHLTTTLYFAAAMLGGLAFGALSDRFGRQPVVLLCLYGQLVLGIGLFFVRRLILFVSVRILQGFLVQGLQGSTLALLMELLPTEQRPAAAAVAGACWALGLLLLTAASFVVKHWLHVLLTVYIPGVATLLYIWLVPESLRWLLMRGRHRQARSLVIRIADHNGCRVSADLLRVLGEAWPPRRQQHETPLRRAGRICRTVLLVLTWCCASAGQCGISIPST